MFRNLFTAAIVAALCAGLVMSVIQHFRVTPLIIHAESFESAAHLHPQGTPSHTHENEGAAGSQEWAPQDGFERTTFTIVANLLAAAGFALVIGAVSLFAGIPITFANGVFWGLAGFLVFSLAPAYGLEPKLPGMPAGDLFARQLWWAGAVLATGAAVLLLAKTRALWAIAAAIVLAALPHLIGAPATPDEYTGVPAHLAAEFAASALGTTAIFWIVLGAAFGRLNDALAGNNA